MKKSVLVLCRHGQSEWNKLNLFTGWRDPPLTAQGVEEAHRAGRRLKALGLRFDTAFTSVLGRAQETCRILLDEVGQPQLGVIASAALNERDYGALSGLNKAEAAKEFGAEQVHVWRRSFDIPPPGGESLKDTAARVIPYYNQVILPHVLNGETVLIAAHGNSLRALIMNLENLSRDDIVKRELATGAPLLYQLDDAGNVLGKQDLAA